MMVIELRKAAQDKAFELIDEMRELCRNKKSILCELEDTLYECFESSEEEYEDEEYEETPEMEFRRRGYRSGMRNHYNDEKMRSYRRGRSYRRTV